MVFMHILLHSIPYARPGIMIARKYRTKVSHLLAVIGYMSLIVGVLYLLSSFFQYTHQREPLQRAAMYFLAGGLITLAARFVMIIFPQQQRIDVSPAVRRRRDYSRNLRRPPRDEVQSGETGSVMLFALILLGLLATLATHHLVTTRMVQAEAAVRMEIQALRLAALDGARAAMQALADDEDLLVDHPGEAWAKVVEVIDPANTSRMVTTTDLNRKFDLNNMSVALTGDELAPDRVLSGILIYCDILTPGPKLDALRDWTDPDPSGVYEDLHYRDYRNPGYTTPGRALFGMSELFMVEGWTPALFAPRAESIGRTAFNGSLADCTTIIPVSRERIIPVNINTASPDLLLALFGYGREALVENLVARRKNHPLPAVDTLLHMAGLDESAALVPYLDVRSSWFHIHAAAFRENGRRVRLDLVVRRETDGRVEVVQATFS